MLLVSLPNHIDGSSQSEMKSFDAKPNGQLTTVTTTLVSNKSNLIQRSKYSYYITMNLHDMFAFDDYYIQNILYF